MDSPPPDLPRDRPPAGGPEQAPPEGPETAVPSTAPLGTTPTREPVQLHPMTIGELLDRAIKLYQANWKLMLGIASFVVVPALLLQSFLTRSIATPFFRRPSQPPTESEFLVAFITSMGFLLINLFFIYPFLTAAFARATIDVYLGESPTISNVYRFALRRIGSILLVGSLIALAVMGGMILLVVPAFIFAVRFAFSSTAVVAEELRGREAMRRSWRLVKGSSWKVFGTLLLSWLLTTILSGIIGFPLALIAEFTGPFAWVLRGIGAALAEIITRPFAAVVAVLLYFDLRIRKEGFDLVLLARGFAEGTALIPVLSPAPDLCPNGHPVRPGARFCTLCGLQLRPE